MATFVAYLWKCMPRHWREQIAEERTEATHVRIGQVKQRLQNESDRLKNQIENRRRQAVAFNREGDKKTAIFHLAMAKSAQKMYEKTLNSYQSIDQLGEILNQQKVAHEVSLTMKQVVSAGRLRTVNAPDLEQLLNKIDDYLGDARDVADLLQEPGARALDETGVLEDELEDELRQLMAEDTLAPEEVELHPVVRSGAVPIIPAPPGYAPDREHPREERRPLITVMGEAM